MRTRRTKQTGQAVVEFALAATLLFFLLAAAVDLGLLFFTLQGLNNAAQEGATYGSRWLITDANGKRVLNAESIRDRVRHEAGTEGGIGFVNLLDLNNNDIPDVSPDTATGTKEVANGVTVIDDYIRVMALYDANYNGNPLDDGAAPGYTPCTDPSRQDFCYIYVSASFDYKFIFPLAPVFGDTVRITSPYIMPLRDSYSRG